MDVVDFVCWYGLIGLWLVYLLKGDDIWEVKLSCGVKSILSEMIFCSDIFDFEILCLIFCDLVEKVFFCFKKVGFVGWGIMLKFKMVEFKMIICVCYLMDVI